MQKNDNNAEKIHMNMIVFFRRSNFTSKTNNCHKSLCAVTVYYLHS